MKPSSSKKYCLPSECWLPTQKTLIRNELDESISDLQNTYAWKHSSPCLNIWWSQTVEMLGEKRSNSTGMCGSLSVYNEPYIEKRLTCLTPPSVTAHVQLTGGNFIDSWLLRRVFVLKLVKIHNSLKIKSPALGAHFFHYLLEIWQWLAHYSKYL